MKAPRNTETDTLLDTTWSSSPTLAKPEQASRTDGEALQTLEPDPLAAHSSDPGGLEQGISFRLGTLSVGDRVGPYSLEKLLGRGGMGVVYLASRHDDFERRVALKLVGTPLPTAKVLDRFYRERQILASLQHPNIARLYDGGTTSEALPYFAMEYIEGLPIDAYCDQQNLSLRRRLKLFQKVCAGIHLAHQSLVVHRDLKPGNVLVTAEGIPKLLDFGIAKILEPEAEEPSPLATDLDHHPMTPAYASPEQFSGQAITTVSDVYSLGVLLYQLVCGQPPYQLRGKTLQQTLHLICTEQPLPPSQAFSGSQATEGEPVLRHSQRWKHKLKGDIDSIVLKALRKEPENRYASVAQFSEDIQRHLDGLPVEAHRGNWLYITKKLIRRHTVAFIVGLLILVSAAISTWLWRQAVGAQSRAEAAAQRAEVETAKAVAERIYAERQRQRAESVSQFLEDLFTSADPDASGGARMPVRTILDRGASRIAADLEGEPEIRADLSGTLGTVFNNLGLYPEARALKEEALRLRRASNLGDRAELAIDINNLARFHYDLGDYAKAEPLFRQAEAMFSRLDDPESSATSLLNLAMVLTHQGRHGEALELQHQVLDARRRTLRENHPKIAASLHSLGISYATRDEPSTAEPLLRQSLSIYLDQYGDTHTRVASVLVGLGRIVHEQGRSAEARSLLERALEIRLELLGHDHTQVANVRKRLAAVLLDEGDLQQAGRLIEMALRTLRAKLPADDWTRADAESVWGDYLTAAKRFDEAGPVLETSYRRILAIKGHDDTFTRNARARLERFHEVSQDSKGQGQPPRVAPQKARP